MEGPDRVLIAPGFVLSLWDLTRFFRQSVDVAQSAEPPVTFVLVQGGLCDECLELDQAA